MHGIHSERLKILNRANVAFIAEALQHGKNNEEIDTEDVLIDAEQQLFEKLSNFSAELPEKNREKMILDIIDYSNATQNRYFMYGFEAGIKFLVQLIK